MKRTLRLGDPVPVLPSPESTESEAIGMVQGGAVVDVIEIVINRSKRYAKLKIAIGDVDFLTRETNQVQVGYIDEVYIQEALENPAPPTTANIGLSVIYHRDAVMTAARAGCRFFYIVGHPELCSEIMDLYPDTTVMCRPNLDIRGVLPSVDYVLNRLNGARDSRLIYTGINEGDQIGQGVDKLALRSQFDVELANRIKLASGARYAAGSFSMGMPDITRQDVCEAMRLYYAPHYNSGLFWLDQHTYSPSLAHIHREDTQTIDWNGQTQVIVEHEWLETRWHFYFTRCGFNPASCSRIVCGETGLDEGGVGGFPVHHASDADVVSWVKRYLEISNRAVTVNGIQYASPYAGAAIFEYGDTTAWAGYDMGRYLDSLKDNIWQGNQAPTTDRKSKR